MATQLNIVNDVLRRLRENTVSAVNESTYSQLIAMFLNQAKQLCESRWFWSVYETEVDIALTGGTRVYDLGTDVNSRSWLIRRYDDRVPVAFDYTSGEKTQLYDWPLREVRAWRGLHNTIDDIEQPNIFALSTDGSGYSLELPQAPTGARSWKMYWYVPQDDLAIDGSDDDTELQIPYWPLYTRTLELALNERGEEMGEPGNKAESYADNALSEAIELDMQVNKKQLYNEFTNLENLRNNLYGMY